MEREERMGWDRERGVGEAVKDGVEMRRRGAGCGDDMEEGMGKRRDRERGEFKRAVSRLSQLFIRESIEQQHAARGEKKKRGNRDYVLGGEDSSFIIMLHFDFDDKDCSIHPHALVAWNLAPVPALQY